MNVRAIICPDCGLQRPPAVARCPDCDAEKKRIRQLRWAYKRMDTPARRQRYRPKKGEAA